MAEARRDLRPVLRCGGGRGFRVFAGRGHFSGKEARKGAVSRFGLPPRVVWGGLISQFSEAAYGGDQIRPVLSGGLKKTCVKLKSLSYYIHFFKKGVVVY